ncbi:hypothetical protein LTR10_023919 [Elasticomyces elasticus]|uniref:Ketoreductase (KR) domain-containing protein n=1 Tax=Exophiala sideris TaxID=1016849 RepID=A0ABR0IUA0_9EURO|nr:hypothetical protein LTR10_023919 [Elasticomyces elasticus]KAK5020855.1 hypothetical protein LTS07_011393 [Exophiala sideris]KAK5022992.1 hypothetical protein LTR13_011362 [Exophiala sideris]KAK5048395.1 hypothetical protein LTR69_011407 [Exophiala sideris]KAK5176049.1 hypothetical protein LTR44_011393 [Eurotiomycetes sp. CCFEE 6388]
MLNIVLAGGLGGVGKEVSVALLQRGRSRLTILTRRSAHKTSAQEHDERKPDWGTNYEIAEVDYSDPRT